ncbi:3,4-dihydroxy-2-butanone-4-phosphate synthase [Amycolatopsis acidiphila]|nr:3,4-dihydroxy-2-butanone-4-phosphate synthase [Amycolatopsis acidiphila]
MDDDRDEGALVFAAEKASSALMSFMVRHTCGLVAVAMPGADCDRLELRPMNGGDGNTPYTVTVDAKDGVQTGISAMDRAHTARLLASPDTVAADMTRPGHLMGMRVHRGGVLYRPRFPEAAVDLVRLGRLRPAGVLCEIVSPYDPTRMARRGELEEFAAAHDLALVSIAELVRHRRRVETDLVRDAAARVPTAEGQSRSLGFSSALDASGCLAPVAGDLGADVLVRLHRECLVGDAAESSRCGCRRSLNNALAAIGRESPEVVVYLRVAPDGDGLP